VSHNKKARTALDWGSQPIVVGYDKEIKEIKEINSLAGELINSENGVLE